MANVSMHKCNSCGGPLNVSSHGGRYTCPYCGTINVFDTDRDGTKEIICPRCGVANSKDALHCSECGMKFNIPCPKCGAINENGAAFCINCGVNIPNEIHAQQIIAQERFLQERKAQQKGKSRKRTALVLLGILAGLCCLVFSLIFYTSNLSPSAHMTATAQWLADQRGTQEALEQLKLQYPYNGSNGIYTAYVKSFCVGHKDSTNRDYVISHLLYVQDDLKYSFNWDFSNSYLTDNLGNTFPVTYETSDYGEARIDMDFDPNASSVVLFVKLKVNDSVEIPIALDLADPALTATCSKK